MPSLSAITATFFVTVINRLGIRPPPAEGFLYSNVVQPISIVDSDIAIPTVVTTQLLDAPFTAGLQVAPAINTVLADTGAQVAGNYQAYVMISVVDAAVLPQLAIQRRDAANAANIWSSELYANNGVGAAAYEFYTFSWRIALQLNERLRVLNTVAGGAASRYQANIWLSAN